jgi:hypothetical protein
MSWVHPCYDPCSPLFVPQGCLDEIVSEVTVALAAPTSAADPPAPLPLLRLVAALLEGGLVHACPPLYQGRAAGSWFEHLYENECLDTCYLSSAASACPALGSEGRARLAPHVLAAAPLVLWGAAGGTLSVSWPAAVGGPGVLRAMVHQDFRGRPGGIDRHV